MTKDEFAWLVVRAVGAFILLLVVLDLITILLTSIQAVILHAEVMSESTKEDDLVTLAIRYGRQIERIWHLGIAVAFKAAFAYYCFYRGAWIHRMLTSKLPASE